MDPERRRRIEELFHAARHIQEADRSDFLSAACAGDEQIRREVQSLLEEDDFRQGILDGPSVEVPMAPGAQLGPYRIEAKLGKGGMGEVFRALDTRLNRKVAVKVCADAFGGRFAREARAIAALNHPHICTLHDVGVNYLVMELVEGETLSDRLRNGALPIATALRYGSQIADAVAAAHASGIVHRDLKPGNIMITKSGVKVLDFGLARSQGDETVTLANQVVGTPAYMAPEQRQGRDCDARSDIYALGLVLAEMATGKRLVPGAAAELTGHFAHIVDRCLAPNPEDRWQSAQDVKMELGWAAQQKKEPARPANARRYAIVGTIAFALALVVLAAIKLPWRNSAAETDVVRLAIPLPEEGITANPPGVFGPPAISPDGQTVVVALGTGANRYLWKRRLDSGTFERLAGTQGGNYAFWSPDSRQIGFFAGGKLKKSALSGGEPPTLCPVAEASERGGSWNPSGTIVYGVNYAGLFRVSDRGGDPAQIAGLDGDLGENSLRHPAFLADGKHFICFSRTKNLDNRALYLYALGAPGRKKLALTDQGVDVARDPATDTEYVLFSRAGKLWAQRIDPGRWELEGEPIAIDQDVGLFSASNNGTLVFRRTDIEQGQFTWFDRGGKELGSVGKPVDSWDVEISPDGRYVAFNNHRSLDGHFSIWLIDTARAVSLPFSVQTERSFRPVWSGDGARLYFHSARSSGPQVFVKALDDAGVERPFAEASGILRLQDVSRDGKFLLALKGISRSKTTLVYTTYGKEDWIPLLASGASENNAQISPNAQSAAYESDESGAWEVYVVDFPAARHKQRISIAGGREPRWRADGKELIYYATEGALVSVAFANGSASTQPQRLFNIRFSSEIDGFHYAVSRDGQRIVAMKETGRLRSRDLNVVINWPRLLLRDDSPSRSREGR